MKKEKLVITISDINSSKSFSVNKIIKKVILWIIVVVLLVVTLSFFVISKLTTSVNELSQDREKLTTENNKYSKEIENKRAQIEELGMQLDEIEEIIGIEKEDDVSLLQRATLAKLTSSEKIYMLQTIPSECPLPKCVPTSKFGWRTHPITQKKRFHNGLDLRAARRTDVRATADGVVRYIQDKNEGTLGRVVIISHNFGFETAYGHLRFVDVKAGDIIHKGQLIARSGNSGRSSGPHLHYEIRYANKILNPTSFTKWNMKNYDQIFEKQRRVEWESLIKLIKSQKNKLAQQ
ncbi:M23 family metallopeptidase [Arcobacter sp. 15-2]|uniref:M23 family metallopeptidase n=1 Tax=Arcobacter sp. 15-2 TaxID=3374109 RepID=UPI00399CEAD7